MCTHNNPNTPTLSKTTCFSPRTLFPRSCHLTPPLPGSPGPCSDDATLLISSWVSLPVIVSSSPRLSHPPDRSSKLQGVGFFIWCSYFFYYIIVFIKYINYLCPLVQISSSISNLSQVFMLKNLQKSCKNRVLRNHISFTSCHTLFILLSLCVCIYYFY